MRSYLREEEQLRSLKKGKSKDMKMKLGSKVEEQIRKLKKGKNKDR